MTCREFIAFLQRYLENELPEDQRRRFDEHLAICESCVSYLSNYRDTIELAKACYADPDGPVPEDVPEELVNAILASRRPGDGAR
jgi:predicted anti-sigma-YlaC factor YlaD